jgi:hypothetical protein
MIARPEETAVASLEDLILRPPIEIAVDTVHRGKTTLAVQTACRVSADAVAVRIYRSPTIPRQPRGFDLEAYVAPTPVAYGRFLQSAIPRISRKFSTDPSPVEYVAGLLDLREVTAVSRGEGRALLAAGPEGRPRNPFADPRNGCWRVPTLRVVLVGHDLTRDFGRLFGRGFYDGLLRPEDGATPLLIRDGKLIGFAGAGPAGAYAPPIVEYATGPDGSMYAVRLAARDAALPFGNARFDQHRRTFLGELPPGPLTAAEADDMAASFAERTADAYGEAARRVVDTLLIYEAMRASDAGLYTPFATADAPATPPMRPTTGARVATFLIHMTRLAAAGSVELRDERRVRALMKAGGIDAFTGDARYTRYGEQTARVHGGLSLSRSPTRLWHEAPGMLRDVDMAGCYNAILAGLDVYWGRPIVLEPGRERMSLRDAVELAVRESAPGAWYVRATGDFAPDANVLIPSTLDAVTRENFRRKRRQGGRRAALFSARVESGVVTEATWALIGAMPAEWREAYEGLEADSVVFYPRRMAAGDGPGYDRLVEAHRTGELPWGSRYIAETMQIYTREHVDAGSVSLKFPMREYARRFGGLRAEARETQGKGSAAELAWKLQANTCYGVLASRHLATSNAVAANRVTAAARASACALALALNGIQVITDGVTYRRDQVPACTLAECLEILPDYATRRPEAGSAIPFLDPDSIPEGDAEFSAWYGEHTARFFEVDGPALRAVTGLDLEHKSDEAGDPAFDAMACDGSTNHAKLKADGSGGWVATDMKYRGYGPASKEALRPWIVESYASDRMERLPPLTEDVVRLGVGEATAKAKKAITSGRDAVYLPLG